MENETDRLAPGPKPSVSSGAILKKVRLDNLLGQMAMAKILGVHFKTLSNYENGKKNVGDPQHILQCLKQAKKEGLIRNIDITEVAMAMGIMSEVDFDRGYMYDYLRTALSETTDDLRTTLIMLDVDRLAQINTWHGVIVGNKVLAKVYAALSQIERCFPVRGRSGDDTFFVIGQGDCEQFGLGKLKQQANEIRRYIEVIPWKFISPDLMVTCSVGFARGHLGESAESLVVRALEAIKEARDKGGNKVATFEKLQPGTSLNYSNHGS